MAIERDIVISSSEAARPYGSFQPSADREIELE